MTEQVQTLESSPKLVDGLEVIFPGSKLEDHQHKFKNLMILRLTFRNKLFRKIVGTVGIKRLLDGVTREEILQEKRFNFQHPFLHELCEQSDAFSLLKEAWKRPVFGEFWENEKYIDQYGFTVLKRLSKKLSDYDHCPRTKWIENNMYVIPEKWDGVQRCYRFKLTVEEIEEIKKNWKEEPIPVTMEIISEFNWLIVTLIVKTIDGQLSN
jgi:hypothetical protein